ncbi:MAG: hypothetical protein ABJC04_11150 [Verrucomicrobiota bacterium]
MTRRNKFGASILTFICVAGVARGAIVYSGALESSVTGVYPPQSGTIYNSPRVPFDLDQNGSNDFEFFVSSVRFAGPNPGSPDSVSYTGHLDNGGNPAGYPLQKYSAGMVIDGIAQAVTNYTFSSGLNYVGLRLQKNDGFHFGWASFTTVAPSQGFGTRTVTLTGFAYESTPNIGIVAGATGQTSPQLALSLVGTNVVITWPSNTGGTFSLQSTTNLVSPIVWNAVLTPPVVLNGRNTVTNSIAGAQKFFRLVQ